MANERLYLVHVPSMLGCAIGKRMGFGWYTNQAVNMDDVLNNFYDEVELNPGDNQDDFILVFESQDDWEIESKLESGVLVFSYKGNAP